MDEIIITDSSLRDGNHSVKHTISLKSIKKYCQFADRSKIPIIEVGHGNGLGASSILIGESPHTDKEILTTARKHLPNSKLGVHIIPGVATIGKDIDQAIDLGVDVFRVASHCSEATVAKSHIKYLQKKNKTVFGVLMMSALASVEELVENAKIMQKPRFPCGFAIFSGARRASKSMKNLKKSRPECFGTHYNRLGWAGLIQLVAQVANVGSTRAHL